MLHVFYTLSCLKRQVFAKEGWNLPGMEKMIPLTPNYYKFAITGLSRKDMGK